MRSFHSSTRAVLYFSIPTCFRLPVGRFFYWTCHESFVLCVKIAASASAAAISSPFVS